MFNPAIWIPLSIALILPMAIRKAQENKLAEIQNSKVQNKTKNKLTLEEKNAGFIL